MTIRVIRSRGASRKVLNNDGRPAPGSTRERAPRLGLSGKLLVLTILFVMIAEVLIYVPSIANFRLNWLNDRLSAAYTAALVFEAAPGGMVPENVARQILDSIGARAVAMKMGQQRRLLAAIRDAATRSITTSTCATCAGTAPSSTPSTRCSASDDDVIRVVGPAPMGGEFVEIVLDEEAAARQDAAPSRATFCCCRC